jgi:hypothetical protein
MSEQQSQVPSDHGQKIPSPRRGWLIIYTFFAILGLAGGIIGLVYRQLPKKSEVLAKRKLPALRSVYALVLSPLSPAMADSLSRSIKAGIGADSTRVKMVVGGTAVYKHCTSADEFRRLIDTAVVRARPADIEIQNLLHSKMLDVINADTLPARLYIMGSAPNMNMDSLKLRMAYVADYLDMRNRGLGKITIVNALYPRDMLQNRLYTSFYKARGISLEEF